jgi:hypothetical protein
MIFGGLRGAFFLLEQVCNLLRNVFFCWSRFATCSVTFMIFGGLRDAIHPTKIET